MKIHIGIIEDEQLHINQLRDLLNNWQNMSGVYLQIEFFFSAENFLLKNDLQFDLIFMDIMLGKMNGLQLTQILHEKKYNGRIIFLTAHKEYVFEGFRVHAFDYLLKPITYDRLQRCMYDIIEYVSSDLYIYKSRSEIIRIPYNEILYFTSAGHYTDIITTNYNYSQLISFKEVTKKLPDFFKRCHRSVIVNTEHIQSLKKKNLQLDTGDILPVSDTYLSDIQEEMIGGRRT